MTNASKFISEQLLPWLKEGLQSNYDEAGDSSKKREVRDMLYGVSVGCKQTISYLLDRRSEWEDKENKNGDV